MYRKILLTAVFVLFVVPQRLVLASENGDPNYLSPERFSASLVKGEPNDYRGMLSVTARIVDIWADAPLVEPCAVPEMSIDADVRLTLNEKKPKGTANARTAGMLQLPLDPWCLSMDEGVGSVLRVKGANDTRSAMVTVAKIYLSSYDPSRCYLVEIELEWSYELLGNATARIRVQHILQEESAWVGSFGLAAPGEDGERSKKGKETLYIPVEPLNFNEVEITSHIQAGDPNVAS